jgi:hypothetical protein
VSAQPAQTVLGGRLESDRKGAVQHRARERAIDGSLTVVGH